MTTVDGGAGASKSRERRALVGLLGIAIGVRLAVIAALGSHEWWTGGDGPWYVRQGWLIAHAALPVPLRTVGPLYPLTLAAVWLFFPGHGDPADAMAVAASYLATVRLLQAGLGTLTVALAYALARGLGVPHRWALVSAAGIALGPAFAMEPFLLHTETLFMPLLTGALLLHVRGHREPTAIGAAVTGGVTALAILTRPIVLLFPAVLAVHTLMVHGRTHGVRPAGALLLGAMLTLAPWHGWLYVGTGSPLPEGFAANFFMGALGSGQPLDSQAFHVVEGRLGAAGRGYVEEATRVIAADPGRWLSLRAVNIAAAIAQPYGTAELGGPSEKAALRAWLRDDRSAHGLWTIASRPTFPIRTVVYVFHYVVLALSIVGIWATWPERGRWFPIYAAVAYLVAAYGLLTISPRYIFPAEISLWVLAGAGLARASARDKTARRNPR